MIVGTASPLARALAQVVRPGGLGVLGPADNVWLAALGLAVLGPALATVAPRLVRPLAVAAAMVAMATAFVATYREETILGVALITFAITCGFVSSWSAATLRTSIGPRRSRPLPRQRVVRGVVLRGGYSRAFDRL